jgi:ABC-2 type transport system ATP-binding protein
MSVEPTADTRPIVEVRNLSRRFGSTDALAGVSLSIPRGVVFGLVGTNGAGKTTLIKHIMGLLRAQSGSVSVFGLDPVTSPTAVLSRVGYLSELNELPEWMRVDELINFTRAFYPAWDERYAQSLCQSFELEPHRIVQSLSKGQRARLGLVLALSYRAELLILDEPSSGLDPLVRRDILRAIIKTIADEGRTVLFSSHLLDEVERVADHVAIIDGGRIIQNDDLESLKSRFNRLSLNEIFLALVGSKAAPPGEHA